MTTNWLFWIGGGLLGLAGLWLFYWALIADRAKGRKRCPKCWYNMQAAENLRCPECGKTTKTERKLLKTRRHWRWAFVAILLLLGSLSIEVAPFFRNSDWRWNAPATLLVLHVYFTDDWESFEQIKFRGGGSFEAPESSGYVAIEEKLADWQWRLVMASAIHRLGDTRGGFADFEIIHYLSGGPPYSGLAIESLSSLLAEYEGDDAAILISYLHESVWASSLSSKERDVWVSTLIETLEKTDEFSKTDVVKAIGECGPEAVVAVPQLLDLLEEDYFELRRLAVEQIATLVIVPMNKVCDDSRPSDETKAHITFLLSQVGTSLKGISEVMIELLDHFDEDVRLAAALSLCQLGDVNQLARQEILDNLMRPDGSQSKIFERLRFFITRLKFLLPGLEYIINNPQNYPSDTVRDAKEMKQKILGDLSP